MEKTLKIRIEIDREREKITITDDAGNNKKLKGIMIIGVGTDDFYMVGIGDHQKVAYAFGEGLVCGLAHNQAIGDNWYDTFFKHLLYEIAKQAGIRPENEITTEEALKKFEADIMNVSTDNGNKKKVFN